jgi:hypothetical protein
MVFITSRVMAGMPNIKKKDFKTVIILLHSETYTLPTFSLKERKAIVS